MHKRSYPVILGLLLSTSVYAQSVENVFEGRVVDIVNSSSFVMEGANERTVVYHKSRETAPVALGKQVRVIGKPIEDWMRVGGKEVNADQVEVIGPGS